MPNFNIKGMDCCVFSSLKVIQDFIIAWFSDSMRLSKTSVFFFSPHIAVNSVTLFLASEKVRYNNSMGHIWTPDPRGEGRASYIRFLSWKEGNGALEASLSSCYVNSSAPWRQHGVNLQQGTLLLAQAESLLGRVPTNHLQVCELVRWCAGFMWKKIKSSVGKNISVRRPLALMISKVILTNPSAVHDSTHPGLYETIHLRLHLRAGARSIAVDPQFASRFPLVQL